MSYYWRGLVPLGRGLAPLSLRLEIGALGAALSRCEAVSRCPPCAHCAALSRCEAKSYFMERRQPFEGGGGALFDRINGWSSEEEEATIVVPTEGEAATSARTASVANESAAVPMPAQNPPRGPDPPRGLDPRSITYVAECDFAAELEHGIRASLPSPA